MQTAMDTATRTAPVPATRIWVGRSISALAALFLLLDGVIKALQLAPPWMPQHSSATARA